MKDTPNVIWAERATLLLFPATLLVFLITLPPFPQDTADGLLHFQYARFAFSHPENLLDHWAKPLYTLIMALPAALGGIKAVVATNFILLTLAGWCVMQTGKNLKLLSYPALPWIFLASYQTIFTAIGPLTEILFLTALAGLGYMLSANKLTWAGLLAGALLFIRPEAIVTLPLTALVLLYKKDFKAILAIGVVPLLYSIIGWFALGDFFWLFTHQPYAVESVYGSGELLHFVNGFHNVIPQVFWIFLFSSLPILIYKWWQKKLIQPSLWLWISLNGLLIFTLHTLLWYWGKMGSFGLIRTLTTAMPAYLLLTGAGIHVLFGFFTKQKIVIYALSGIMVVFCVWKLTSLGLPYVDSKIGLAQRIHSEVKMDLSKNRVAFQYVLNGFLADVDPFDKTKSLRLWDLHSIRPSMSLYPGDYLIWDNVTGHREGRLSFETVSNDPHLKLLAIDSVNRHIIAFFRKTETPKTSRDIIFIIDGNLPPISHGAREKVVETENGPILFLREGIHYYGIYEHNSPRTSNIENQKVKVKLRGLDASNKDWKLVLQRKIGGQKKRIAKKGFAAENLDTTLTFEIPETRFSESEKNQPLEWLIYFDKYGTEIKLSGWEVEWK